MLSELTRANARTLARLGQSGAIFGAALVELADGGLDAFVLTADMGNPAGMARFKGRYPERFVNVGIAEQNLVGVAAGICSEGHAVVASAQAAFISMRSFEQVRQYAGYMRLPLVLVGVAAGFGLTFFGNTHYAIEDIALMRAIPGMTVVSPSDAGQATKAIAAGLASRSPVYIRCTGGRSSPVVYDSEFDFELGRAIELRQGRDVTIFATGAVVTNALRAAVALSEHGIDAGVVDVHTLKPLDAECVRRHVDSRLFVTVEEHSVVGGLGAAVAEVLSALRHHPPLMKIGVDDRFFTPGDYEYLIAAAGLDVPSIVARVRSSWMSNVRGDSEK
jgi:transketolase